MGLIDRFRHRPPKLAERSDPLISLSEYLSWFTYNGVTYPFLVFNQHLGERQEEPIGLEGYVQSFYRSNGVVFACMMARLLLFSEARFQFRQLRQGRPGDLFGTQDLEILEHPWPGGTTGDLLARAIVDVDVAGNFFCVRHGNPPMLHRLRPDWVYIVVGDPASVDARVLGYIYQPGGHASAGEPVTFGPEEVCHFAPIPDPMFRFRGMSWLTPIMREVMADSATNVHRLKFFENGATKQMVGIFDASVAEDTAQKWIAKFREGHEGVANAYKTLFMGGGITKFEDISSTMQQMDFKVTQGAGETRICANAGMHPVIIGLSEGLQGSSLNAGNFNAARRLTADRTLRPLWRNFAASMQTIVPPPPASELWYDERGISFLREDAKDAAEIAQIEAATIAQLVNAGYKPETVISAVLNGDWARLVHTGLFSVQLQPPQSGVPQLLAPPPNGKPAQKVPAA